MQAQLSPLPGQPGAQEDCLVVGGFDWMGAGGPDAQATGRDAGQMRKVACRRNAPEQRSAREAAAVQLHSS